MKATIFLLAAYTACANATALVKCGVSHCSNGNTFHLVGGRVDDGSESSICGSLNKRINEAVKADKSKLKFHIERCETKRKGGNQNILVAKLVFDKESPTHQANVLAAGLYNAFGGSGVQYWGCDVSRIPA